jgi:hypothetical protein
MTANGWRWLALLFSGGTLIGGVIGLCLGGSKWPAIVGAVVSCTLGEVWRWQLRREWSKLDARNAEVRR